MFKRLGTIVAIMGGLVLAACQTTGSSTGGSASAGWDCDAKGLASGSYSGGSTAYIHLASYNNGNDYSVQKVGENKVVGTTGDGTPFTCTKK